MQISIKPFEFTPRSADGKQIGEDRAPGLHLTTITKRLEEAAEGKPKNTLPDDQPWFRAQVGFLWERALEWAWKEYMQVERPHVMKQLALSRDGVEMTPDGLDIGNGEHVLEEYKATWKSMRRLEQFQRDFWGWLIQSMAYAAALGVTKVRFFVLFMQGDYKKNEYTGYSGPQAVQIDCEFTQVELDDNWRMILREAQKLR